MIFLDRSNSKLSEKYISLASMSSTSSMTHDLGCINSSTNNLQSDARALLNDLGKYVRSDTFNVDGYRPDLPMQMKEGLMLDHTSYLGV